ncbi:hypothetical protein [Glaciecola petra]|uniref:Serine acetyltransferase n=1 Tax=Glaciecola petra TaxID=3075602 RepID=A0ABU2ZMA1_9ALTE|nr:hypothetical protein [Aestuariibacter sp. P117]MDT0593760.1 hypothetical protein [Aestuariibacter sp. P117]
MKLERCRMPKPKSNDSFNCRKYGHASWRGMWFNVRQDINRYLNKSPLNRALGKSWKRKLSAFLTPEILCLFIYRLSHFLHVNDWNLLGRFVARINLSLFKVHIPSHSCIGPACRLSHPPGVVFEGRAGRNLTIFSLAICQAGSDFISPNLDICPQLGNHVQLGAYTVTTGQISLQDGVRLYPVLAVDSDITKEKLVIRKKPHYKKVVRHTVRNMNN